MGAEPVLASESQVGSVWLTVGTGPGSPGMLSMVIDVNGVVVVDVNGVVVDVNGVVIVDVNGGVVVPVVDVNDGVCTGRGVVVDVSDAVIGAEGDVNGIVALQFGRTAPLLMNILYENKLVLMDKKKENVCTLRNGSRHHCICFRFIPGPFSTSIGVHMLLVLCFDSDVYNRCCFGPRMLMGREFPVKIIGKATSRWGGGMTWIVVRDLE